MAIPSSLAKLEGSWQSINHLWLDPSKPARTSDSVANVAKIINGQTLEINYTWADKGEPQSGKLLINQVKGDEFVHAVWFDSWHMADQMMELAGTHSAAGAYLSGSYAAPPGPDWGWQIAIDLQESGWRLQMYNVSPDGQVDLAVEAQFTN